MTTTARSPRTATRRRSAADLDDRRRIASLSYRAADSLVATGNPEAARESLRAALTVYADLDDPAVDAIRRLAEKAP